MKITVSQGTNITEALTAIIDFFKENCSDYEYTKAKATLYLGLKDKEKNICPLNEREFMYKNGKIVDSDDDAVSVAKEAAIRQCLRICGDRKYKKYKAIKEKEKAENNYNKAIEKGFSTAEKWKKEIEKQTELLAKLLLMETRLDAIKADIENNNYKVFTYISKEKGLYKINVRAGVVLLFRIDEKNIAFHIPPHSSYPQLTYVPDDYEPNSENEFIYKD